MTESDVLFDTWAWWEVLQGSEIGSQLNAKYLKGARRAGVLTSAISIAELSARLSSDGLDQAIESTTVSIRESSTILDVTTELASQAGPLRTRLRKRVRTASLADAIILATARSRGARVISNDSALVGEPDVSVR